MSTAQSTKKEEGRSDRYKVWLKQAKFDLQAARVSHDNKFYEWACFQSEQSAEKALKAVLVHAGWRPPKMHKLSVLIGFCNHANNVFKKTKFKFHDLESFTFISRYPFLIPGNLNTPHEYITSSDSMNCINQADSIYSKIRPLLEDGATTYSDEEVQKIIDRQKLIKRLMQAIHNLERTFNLEEIYLFGSYARKENKAGSTIDLMIIADTEMTFINRIRKAVDVLAHGYPPIEPLVYTRNEFDLLSKSEGFFETAMEESILIYQKGQQIDLEKEI